MKIKRPVLSKKELETFYYNCMEFVATLSALGISQLDANMHKLKDAYKQSGNTSEDLAHYVGEAEESRKKLIHYLREALEGRKVLVKGIHFEYYQKEYLQYNNVFNSVCEMFNKYMRIDFNLLDVYAGRVTIDQTEEPGMKDVIKYASLCAGWSNYLRSTANAYNAEWRKACKNQLANIPFARAVYIMSDYSLKMHNSILREFSKNDYNIESLPFRQWDECQKTIKDKADKMLIDAEFRKKQAFHSFETYIRYYVACACKDFATYGVLPEKVEEEVGEYVNLGNFRKMVRTVVEKVPRPDDELDYQDYLKEHPWTLMQELIDKYCQLREARGDAE